MIFVRNRCLDIELKGKIMRFMLALVLSAMAAACLAKSDPTRSIVVEYVSASTGVRRFSNVVESHTLDGMGAHWPAKCLTYSEYFATFSASAT